MNNPNPFVPESSLAEQKNKARSSLKIKIFCLLAINVAALMVLLMQGCKREQAPPPETTGLPPITDTNLPPVETNLPPPMAETNVPPPPVVEQTPAPASVPSTTEYVVQKGDSFYSIGKKMGVSMKAIADANPGVDSKKLKVGQKLVIPAAATAVAATAGGAVASAAEGAEQVYVVKSGDTLTRIAARFGTTVKAIRAANNLTTDKIKVGQKLKIQAKAAATVPVPVPAAPVEPAPATPVPSPAPVAPPAPQ